MYKVQVTQAVNANDSAKQVCSCRLQREMAILFGASKSKTGCHGREHERRGPNHQIQHHSLGINPRLDTVWSVLGQALVSSSFVITT